MLDLDKYINNNVEMKIGGDVLHVIQPSVEMIDKIDTIEKDMTEENIREKRIEVVCMMLNHNMEGAKIKKESLYKWTQEALMKVITTMSLLRYEADTDPN